MLGHSTNFFIMYTHTHPFNGPFSGTTQVSQYQKGKTNLDFTEARDSEWQWHHLGHMQVCTSLQTDNHASTPPLFFYRPDALPASQPTLSKHWRPLCNCTVMYSCIAIFCFVVFCIKHIAVMWLWFQLAREKWCTFASNTVYHMWISYFPKLTV